MTEQQPSRLRDRLPVLLAALGSPLFVLAVVWLAAQGCRRFWPAGFPVVAVGGLLLWLGTIYLVGRTIHRLLWQDRVSEAGRFGKVLMTALLTALWFGIIAQSLAVAFPAYFKR